VDAGHPGRGVAQGPEVAAQGPEPVELVGEDRLSVSRRPADRTWLETAASQCLLLYPLAYYGTHFLLYRYRLPLELMLLLALACAAARALPSSPPASTHD